MLLVLDFVIRKKHSHGPMMLDTVCTHTCTQSVTKTNNSINILKINPKMFNATVVG